MPFHNQFPSTIFLIWSHLDLGKILVQKRYSVWHAFKLPGLFCPSLPRTHIWSFSRALWEIHWWRRTPSWPPTPRNWTCCNAHKLKINKMNWMCYNAHKLKIKTMYWTFCNVYKLKINWTEPTLNAHKLKNKQYELNLLCSDVTPSNDM